MQAGFLASSLDGACRAGGTGLVLPCPGYCLLSMFFECHDDPGAGKEEDEEQGVVSQVRPLVHTTQAVVLEDSLAICVGGGGGDGVRMVKGGGAGQGWFDSNIFMRKMERHGRA